MGQAADRKVTEIDETRRQLELDITELEERLPASLRSMKTLAGLVFGSTFAALLARRLLSRSSKRDRASKAEVVVRIVRDDQPPR